VKNAHALAALMFIFALGPAMTGCVELDAETADLEQALGVEPLKTPSSCAVFYRGEAEIQAPASVVWELLSDLPGYASWNPWIIEAHGDLVPGGTVYVQAANGGQPIQAEHYVLVVDEESTLCWRDAGWNSWFVQAQRCRWIEEQPDGSVHFHQELFLDGILAGIADLAMGAGLRAGVAAETAALKQHAEAAAL
jgi:polyketide cyclase/dehydrase/lipid transport protein